MSSRPHLAFIIFILFSLTTGCSKNSPRFEAAYIEMTLQDFAAKYPHAQKVAEAKGTTGVPFSVYQKEEKNRSAQYFFSENALVGIVVIFSGGAQFDSIVDELTSVNGEPASQFITEGAKTAVWKKGDYFINMIQSTTKREIKLPNGILHPLNPGDILLMLGRKNR
jgi:hypothetical protein